MSAPIWDYRNPYEWMERVRTTSFPPMIVSCAITGGFGGKEGNPNFPETPEEQAEEAYRAYKAGAVMVHIHARNPERLWQASPRTEDYLKINKLVRAKCPDIIINNTTGGGPELTVPQRMGCLDANPEMASLNLGGIVVKAKLKERKAPIAHPHPEIMGDLAIPLTYGEIEQFAKAMKDRGIRPEMELFHSGMYHVMQDLMQLKLIEPPYLVQFVLGFMTGTYPTPRNVLNLIDELPANSMFEVIGVGPFQLPMNTMGILLGGHVRVGMEDNLYYSRGRLLKTSGEAVERVIRIAKEHNREIATVAQAREMLGLSQTPSKY